MWWTAPADVLAGAGLTAGDLPGALHAAIRLLPLLTTCDRWDVGGVSTALPPDTGLPTVVVHDAHPGGAGFGERGYAVMPQRLQATCDAIATCGCPTGCPSCVQSLECRSGNEPLDKAGALRLLRLVLRHAQQDEASQ